MTFKDILEASKKFFVLDFIGFLITLLVILIATVVTIKLTRRFIRSLTKRNRIDETSARFTYRILASLIYIFAIFGIVSQIVPLRNMAVSLLAGSGVAIIVIGFAAQEAFSNIIAGFFISFFRPYSVGDLLNIPANDIVGRVEDINLRHTVIRTFANNRVIIPNRTMNQAILENRDILDRKICNFLTISISYQSDIDKARAIMIEEALKHPLLLDERSAEEIENNEPQIRVLLANLGNFSVDLRCSLWTSNTTDGFYMMADLRESIKKRFDAEGIEIPFPYQNVILRNKQ